MNHIAASFVERCRLRTILGMALMASACGGVGAPDTSSDPSGASTAATPSPVRLTFDLDTAAHKTGTAFGNGVSVAFDFTRNDKSFALNVTTPTGAPLVAYAATPDAYVERVLGSQLEITWSRALLDARTSENTAALVAQTRHVTGDEHLLTYLAERPEYRLVNALHRALKTSIDEATASGPSVLALPPGDGEGGGGTGGQCMAECRGDGHTQQECNKKCLGNPPYGCTPQDNSADHNACVAGVDAWAIGCFADPIDVLNPFMDIACFLFGLDCPTCDSIGSQLRNDCPPSTICL